MISNFIKRARVGVALLAAGTAISALPAAAQVPQSGQYREDPGSALNRHLRSLADQPRNLQALIGAGKAALKLGDAQAALTFFARAEEVAPRDGRVKAGMGSAFLQMEQPIPAMRFFDEAMALGIPEAEFAGDRGLAFDLAGNQRRAQADYTVALRRQEDPEIRRRLALSLAISGERDKALATIDDQLRRQDRVAWRTRAFILALSGDVAEATRTTQSVMPGLASQLSPFYAKLASLGPAERAMAVHFGHLPVGTPVYVAASPQNQYASAASVAAPQVAQQQPAQRGSSRGTRAPRPGAATQAPAAPVQQAPAAGTTRNRLVRERWDARSETRGASRSDRQQQTPPAAATRATGATALARRQQAPITPRQNAPVQQAPAPVQAQSSWTMPVARAPAGVQAQPAWTAPVSQAPGNGVQAQSNWTSPAAQAPAPAPVAQAPVQPSWAAPAARTTPQPVWAAPVTSQQPATALAAAPPQPTPSLTPPQTQQPSQVAAAPLQAPAQPSQIVTATQTPAPEASQALTGFSLTPSEPRPADIQPIQLVNSAVAVTDASAIPPSQAAEAEPDFAEIAAVVAQLPREAPARLAVKPVELAEAEVPKPSPPAAEQGPKRPAAKVETAKKQEPAKAAEKPQLAKKEQPAKASSKAQLAKKEEPAKAARGKGATTKKGDAADKDPKADAKKSSAKKEPAKKAEAKEPSRIWVQVAGGADKAALPREFAKLKGKAPKLLGDRTAWTTPLRFTNRLLVGPFKTEKEAQAFVNELNKLDFSAFSWTSPAGQEIEKLAVK